MSRANHLPEILYTNLLNKTKTHIIVKSLRSESQTTQNGQKYLETINCIFNLLLFVVYTYLLTYYCTLILNKNIDKIVIQI